MCCRDRRRVPCGSCARGRRALAEGFRRALRTSVRIPDARRVRERVGDKRVLSVPPEKKFDVQDQKVRVCLRDRDKPCIECGFGRAQRSGMGRIGESEPAVRGQAERVGDHHFSGMTAAEVVESREERLALLRRPVSVEGGPESASVSWRQRTWVTFGSVAGDAPADRSGSKLKSLRVLQDARSICWHQAAVRRKVKALDFRPGGPYRCGQSRSLSRYADSQICPDQTTPEVESDPRACFARHRGPPASSHGLETERFQWLIFESTGNLWSAQQ